MMNPNLDTQHSDDGPNIYGACGFCGATSGPMVHAYAPDGTAYRIWCADERACTARQDAEATWADQRFTITAAGRAVLAETEAA
jgi:hypothetical protein